MCLGHIYRFASHSPHYARSLARAGVVTVTLTAVDQLVLRSTAVITAPPSSQLDSGGSTAPHHVPFAVVRQLLLSLWRECVIYAPAPAETSQLLRLLTPAQWPPSDVVDSKTGEVTRQSPLLYEVIQNVTLRSLQPCWPFVAFDLERGAHGRIGMCSPCMRDRGCAGAARLTVIVCILQTFPLCNPSGRRLRVTLSPCG